MPYEGYDNAGMLYLVEVWAVVGAADVVEIVVEDSSNFPSVLA